MNDLTLAILKWMCLQEGDQCLLKKAFDKFGARIIQFGNLCIHIAFIKKYPPVFRQSLKRIETIKI